MAETLTDKLKLSKRDTGDINWGQGANANLDAVDSHAQQATLRPPRTLSASLGSGAAGANLLGSTTYFYKITAVNAAGETTEGKIPAAIEAQVTESASPVPVILSWETVKGATSYKIYKSTLSGQEKFLASVAGESTAIYTDDGNTAVNSAISVPAANTARTSVSKIVAGTNVTVTPPDGTGEVTINAASAAPPDASTTVKGVSKLSVAPALATDPIAVGDNDPRNANARTPTGAAGGDLSGTYPNPTVAKVNGTSVPASPSAGQVLTATGPTAAAWQAPAGGSSTTVVAAATGVAATDTANIQNAINGLPAAGGTVVLREGTYVLNASITFPSAKPVTFMGQGPGTSISLTTAFENTFPSVFINTTGDMDKITLRDFRFVGVSRFAQFVDFSAGAGQTFSDLTFSNLVFILAGNALNLSAFSGGKLQNVMISDCLFVDPSASIKIVQNAATVTGITISGTHTRKATGLSGVFVVNLEGTKINFVDNVIDNQGLGSGITVSQGTTTPASEWVIVGNTIASPLPISIPNAFTLTNSLISNNRLLVTGAGTLSLSAIGAISNSVIEGNTASHPIQLSVNAASVGNIFADNKATVTDNSGQANSIDRAREIATATAAVVVSGAAAPTAGQVLTATGPTAAAWQAPAGGGGYATVVVAAPSGSAATDTANIQNAINAAAGSFGGTVVLREGNYLINSTLSIPSVVCIRGQGMDITTLFASGLPGSAPMLTAGAGNNLIQIQDLTLNFNKVGRGAITALDDVHFTGQDNRFTRVKFIGNAGSTCLSFGTIANGLHNIVDACQFIMNGSANATALFGGGDLYVSNCYFNNTVTMLRMITVGFNAYICNNLFELGAGGTQVIFSNGGNDMNIANNTFQLLAGTWTNAIKAFGPTRYTIIGNTASAMTVGDINCSGSNGVIACNAGFLAYVGGSQAANDTQTFNGIAVGTAAPSAGQILTATGPGAAAWQTPGPAGYATVVVAAPTLNAATDTANIQAALDALSSAVGSAGGGTVILREGDYVVNQIIIRRDGTRLIGSGPGWSGNSQVKSGTRIRGNVQPNNLVKINADNVTVENVTFVGFHVADGFSIVEAGADFANTSQDLTFFNCAFTDIRSPLAAGIRAGGLHRLRIRDCIFILFEGVQQTVARTPIGIKIGQAVGSIDANLNIEISRCHFRHEYLLPGVGGSILAKDIELNRVLGASIVDCHSLVGNVGAGLTHIFAELKQVSAQGKGVVLQGNNLRRHHNFIKQTGAFVKVALSGNSYADHQGADPVIDLAGGNAGWSLVGNVIEGATGINLQAGADNNVVVGNVANVANAGLGNQVANNVAP